MRATFDNSYARLPEHFYARQHPAPVADPALVAVNTALAQELGIDPDSITAAVIAGNEVPEGATIFVFDLAFALPALVACAALLWRGGPWGDLLALPLLMKLATLGLSVLIGTLIGPLWGVPAALTDVATYAVLALLPAALVPLWWRALAP